MLFASRQKLSTFPEIPSSSMNPAASSEAGVIYEISWCTHGPKYELGMSYTEHLQNDLHLHWEQLKYDSLYHLIH